MGKRGNGSAWYAEWFAARNFVVLTPREAKYAMGSFRSTPVRAYPEGIEVLKGEVGYLPWQGVRVVQQARVQ